MEESVPSVSVRLDGIGKPVEPASEKGGESQDTQFHTIPQWLKRRRPLFLHVPKGRPDLLMLMYTYK